MLTAARVVVERDGLDLIAIWASIAATFTVVVATVIAVLALNVASATRVDLAKERRLDFELTLLREMADLVNDPTPFNMPKLTVRASMLNLIELPWVGQITALRIDPEVREEHARRVKASIAANNGLDSRQAIEPMLDEIRTAIAERLGNRPDLKARPD